MNHKLEIKIKDVSSSFSYYYGQRTIIFTAYTDTRIVESKDFLHEVKLMSQWVRTTFPDSGSKWRFVTPALFMFEDMKIATAFKLKYG